ncbi:hypothetical protein QQM79_19245 [Marinobacteraceae bacterium S3BR75-40.1]
MASTQEERYIRIARACLKAINQAATDTQSRQEQIQAVYNAIHEAFESELAPYNEEIERLRAGLQSIVDDPATPAPTRNQAQGTLSKARVSPPGQPIH